MTKLVSVKIALLLGLTIGTCVTHTALFALKSEVLMRPQPALASAVSGWISYGNRYAVIVMGGDESGQMYTWYWQDCYGMYQHLISLEFRPENIFFLAYGSHANAHPEAVDRVSTKANVQWAFEQVRMRSTSADLLYVFWVDHGTNQFFNLNQGMTMTHAEYNDCIKNIAAKVIIGAYNPCYSGAVIPHISRPGVITITSVNAQQTNSAGWAGWWRTALAGGTSGDPSDKDGDGHVDMTEAYEWVAPKSQAYRPTAEHPLFDDNGDGVGSEYNTAGYNSNDPNKDGFRGRTYSLSGWRSTPDGASTTSTVKTTSSYSTTGSTFSFQFEALMPIALLSVTLIVILLLVTRLRQHVGSPTGSPSIRYCTNCGSKLLEDASFCHSCGARQS